VNPDGGAGRALHGRRAADVIEVSVRVQEGDRAALRGGQRKQDLVRFVPWVDHKRFPGIGVRDDRAVALERPHGNRPDQRAVGHGSSRKASGLVKD
jgi:hypothetical protein